MQYRVYLITSQ